MAMPAVNITDTELLRALFPRDNKTDPQPAVVGRDSSDAFSRGEEAYRLITVAAILPVCVVGLITNSVSVWVWSGNRKRNPTVLLFQCLGVLDNVFLLGTALRGVLHYTHLLDGTTQVYLVPALFLAQSLSVHVTLAIGAVRWLAVARPHGAAGTGRVVGACGGVAAWCVLLTVPGVVTQGRLDVRGEGFLVQEVVLQVLGYVLPTMVLLALSARLLTLTFRQRRNISTTTNNNTTNNKQHRRMTMAVVSIAVCSFLACPVAVAGQLLAVLAPNRQQRVCSWTCAFVAFGLGELLQVINASVNFFLYLFFASKFRRLLQERFSCCLRWLQSARRRVRSVPESSGTQRTSFKQSNDGSREGEDKSSSKELDESIITARGLPGKRPSAEELAEGITSV